MDGPFEQKTGGKGANTAAAAGQTFACDLFGNMGKASERENAALLRDLHTFGAVGTEYISVLPDCPTGTAYILLFEDNDNAILLLGGANQQWPPQEELEAVGGRLYSAISDSVAVMLQREERRTPPSHLNGCIYPVAPTSLFLVMSQVPEYVNVSTARLASSLGKCRHRLLCTWRTPPAVPLRRCRKASCDGLWRHGRAVRRQVDAVHLGHDRQRI